MSDLPPDNTISSTAIAIGSVLLGACASTIIALWSTLKSSRRSEIALLRERLEKLEATEKDLVERVRLLESARLKEAKEYAEELREALREELSAITELAKAMMALREVVTACPCGADVETATFRAGQSALSPGRDHG